MLLCDGQLNNQMNSITDTKPVVIIAVDGIKQLASCNGKIIYGFSTFMSIISWRRVIFIIKTLLYIQ